MGQSFKKVVPTQYISDESEKVGSELGKKGSWKGEVLQMTKEGRQVNILSSVSIMTDANGNLLGSIEINRDITEQKQTEAKAKEFQAKWKSIAETPFDWLSIVDSRGTIQYLNRILPELQGGEVIGKTSIYDFVDPAQKEQIKAIIEEVFETAKPGYYETYVPDFQLWTSNYLGPIVNDGKVELISIMSQNITEQKEAEQKLKETQWILEEAERIAHVGSWNWNIKAGKAYFSDGLYRIFGLLKEKGPPSVDSLLARVRPEDRSKVLSVLEHPKKSGTPFSVEFRFTRYSDKEERFFHAEGEVQLDEQEQPERIVGSVQDITDRILAQAKLKETEERFSKVFYNHITPMLIFDIETGARLEMNKSYLKLFGYTEEECRNNDIYEQNVWIDKREQKLVLERLKIEKEIHDYVGNVRTKSGEVRNLLTNAVLLDIAEGNLGIVSFIDITDRKKMEENLLATQEELSEITERFQTSTAAAKIGIWDWDISNDRLIWDKITFSIYKISKQEFQQRSILNLWGNRIHPDDLVHLKEAFVAALKGKADLYTSFRIIWPDQSIRYVRALATVEHDEQGRAIRMVGTNWGHY